MTTTNKEEIAQMLAVYVEKMGSLKKAEAGLHTVISASNIHNIVKRKWDGINERLWQAVSARLNYKSKDWIPVETRPYTFCETYFHLAKNEGAVFALVGEAGTGKSKSAEVFTARNRNCFRLRCEHNWTKDVFISELLIQMGEKPLSTCLNKLVKQVIFSLSTIENPLLIIDEANQLKDDIWYLFISLYNNLEDHCGIVTLSTDQLEKRIQSGIQHNRLGYAEIFSRLGKCFIRIPSADKFDIKAICIANGVSESDSIGKVARESEFDLRRVKRLVLREKARMVDEESQAQLANNTEAPTK